MFCLGRVVDRITFPVIGIGSTNNLDRKKEISRQTFYFIFSNSKCFKFMQIDHIWPGSLLLKSYLFPILCYMTAVMLTRRCLYVGPTSCNIVMTCCI